MASKKLYSLIDLSEALTIIMDRRLLSQPDISKATGVDQGTISKARKGKLKRKTHKTDVLMDYSRQLLLSPNLSKAIKSEVNNFYSKGGREEDLVAFIRIASNLLKGGKTEGKS